MIDKINLEDYTYELPEERIASNPVTERDQSKLLVYEKGHIRHSRFDQLPQFLPAHSILFFNDTKVIPARILFKKHTGATIEIFLVSPANPLQPVHEALLATSGVRWRCIIGNLKGWPSGVQLTKETDRGSISVELTDREKCLVDFSWSPPTRTLGDILGSAGVTPLPPYIQRPALPEDRERYQTIYSAVEGAVAAPTAGLHFTDRLFGKLTHQGIISDFLTLHVSAGTFQPVKVQHVVEHPMHHEQIIVSEKTIRHLLMPDKKIVAVGTTSMRTLESLYWYGVSLLENPEASFLIQKLDPYTPEKNMPAARKALEAVAEYMQRNKLTSLRGETSLFILPGYPFKVCEALITNFHQPGSTLMLLVAAFVGKDWKKIYREAMENNYRFLSYGDSSLLIPGNRYEL